MVGCANNHAFDYGEGGVLATIRHLDAAGIAHAGSGANLAEARMPGYLDTRGGRVAILATTATFRPWNRAGAQRPDLRGRPGINPFGFKNTYTVDGEAFDQLKRMSRELGFEQKRARQRQHFFSEQRGAAPSATRSSRCSTRRFVRGNGFKVTSEGDKADIDDNLRWIREARRQADWVVVHFHSHEYGHVEPRSRPRPRASSRSRPTSPAPSRAPRSTPAPTSSSATARTRRSGSSSTRASRSSIRSAISSSRTRRVPFFPAVAYERFGLGNDATPADFLDARTGNGKKGHVAHADYWQNIAATCHYRGGKLAEIRIHPVDQGFGRPRGQRGRPVLATARAGARRIIERVDRLSRPYGVSVQNRDGVGIVTPP